jgi:hypothetical protein
MLKRWIKKHKLACATKTIMEIANETIGKADRTE